MLPRLAILKQNVSHVDISGVVGLLTGISHLADFEGVRRTKVRAPRSASGTAFRS